MSRKSVFLSSGDRDLRIAFKVHKGSQPSSRVEVGTSGFLYISDIDFRVSVELEQGSQVSSFDGARNSASL